MQKKLYAILPLLLIIVSSCNYDTIVTEEIVGPVSYSSHIQPIFDNNCTSCHSADAMQPDLTIDNSYTALLTGSYIDTVTPDKSKLILKVTGGHPFTGTPTVNETDLMLHWIEQGAQNN